MDGAQTVQVYVKFLSDGAPNYQLKALKKVLLCVGETKHIEFTLDADSFGLYVDDGVKVLSKGNYEIYVGMSQPDERSIRLTGKRPVCIAMHYDGDDVIVPE